MRKKRIKLGQGAFTCAYLLKDGTVELISFDHIKECMSMGWFPDGRLFPDIEYIEVESKYSTIYIKDKRYLVRLSLTKLMEKLQERNLGKTRVLGSVSKICECLQIRRGYLEISLACSRA